MKSTQPALLAWLPAVALASCVVQSAKPPIQGGDGVDVNSKTGTVSLDIADVPVLPASCAPGQVVGRGDAGWDCDTLSYAQIGDAPTVDWSTVSSSVTSSTEWPGTVPYSQITEAPPVDWSTVSGTVTSSTAWPGTMPYSQVSGAPSVDWSTVSGTVTSSTAWIGTIPYSQITNAPANLATVQSNVTTLQGNVTTLQGNVTTAQSNITTLQGNVTTAQGNITTLQGDMTTAQGNITTLQGDMTTAQGNITTLQTEAAAVKHVALSFGSAVAQTVLVTGQLKDLAGNNVSAQVTLHVETLAQSAGQGAIGPVAGTTIVINTGTPAGQTSEAVITTTSTGSFQYDVTDTQSGDSVWTEAVLDSGVTAGKLLTGY